MAFFSPLGPEDHNAADNELNDAAKQTTTSAQDFIYPPLDMSRSEFRILTLLPGHCDDEINARLQTAYMLALPLSLEDGLHHVQLHEIYEALSSAVGEGTEVQFDELLRWQRLHSELNELYTVRSIARHSEAIQMALGKDSSSVPYSMDPKWTHLKTLAASFISRAGEYQMKSSRPFKSSELQDMIRRIESPTWPPSHEFSLQWGYEAISYYCGDQSVKKRIKLNDVAVEVPATAADALRGLRRNDRERVLWIDALCIDQGNATERAHQVLQLSRIYSSARRTLVWLGDEDETATETLTSALKISSNLRAIRDPNPRAPSSCSLTTMPLSIEALSLRRRI